MLEHRAQFAARMELANSSAVKPRPSSSAMASASPIAACIKVEVVAPDYAGMPRAPSAFQHDPRRLAERGLRVRGQRDHRDRETGE